MHEKWKSEKGARNHKDHTLGEIDEGSCDEPRKPVNGVRDSHNIEPLPQTKLFFSRYLLNKNHHG